MSELLLTLSEEDILSLQAAKAILTKKQVKHIYIDDLAREVGLGRAKLIYGFKSQFGITINGYQVRMKMEKAKELLLETEKPIKQIARLSGYDNKSSFSAAFKRETGVSPTEWRNKMEKRSGNVNGTN